MIDQKKYRINNEYVFDPEQNMLIDSNNEARAIEPMVSSLILYLIQHSPHPVPHDELIKKFWGPTVKSKEALMKTISKSRKLFSTDVIRTVSKVGYQWTAHVEVIKIHNNESPAATRSRSIMSHPGKWILMVVILMIIRMLIFPHLH